MYTIKQRTALVSMMLHLSKKKRTQLTQYLDEHERARPTPTAGLHPLAPSPSSLPSPSPSA
jgi:hypothetical protein